MSICSVPTGSHEYSVTISARSSAGRPSRSKKTPTETMNEATTMPVAR